LLGRGDLTLEREKEGGGKAGTWKENDYDFLEKPLPVLSKKKKKGGTTTWRGEGGGKEKAYRRK